MPTEITTTAPDAFEIKIRILGNEIFAIALSTNNHSARWVNISLLVIVGVVATIGFFGDRFASLLGWVAGKF